MARPQKLTTPVMEDYIKSIYKLQVDGNPVSTTNLSKKMQISPAAITKMLKSLAAANLIEYTPYYGVTLTVSGERIALEIIRHHRLLEVYLCSALGYSWDEVDAEAEKLEHHISEDFEERIDKMLNYPSTDPHGDPIPTREGFMPMQLGNPLSDCQAGESVVVRRVRDSDSAVLRFLTKIGICLETQITILERQPFNGPMRIRIGEIDHSIGLELAGHLFVEPVIAGGMH